MGGILGKLSIDSREPLARPALEQMLEASAGSSDNSRELFIAPGVAIGITGAHGRGGGSALAANDTETLHVAADATITNATVLRAQLEGLGHRFRGMSPSELILRAYEEWGTRAFARLRGPFACAIWNTSDRRLVVARDHAGIRAVYFAVLPNRGVVFASEIRALLRNPEVGRDWCPAGIDAYLALGYVPAPLTPYRRISKLESAHLLIVEGRRLHVERYWDLPLPAERSVRGRRVRPAVDLCRDIRARLRTAIADYTVDGGANGVLYSGGTASTAMLAAFPGTSAAIVTVEMGEDPSELARGRRAASMLGRTQQLASLVPDAPFLARTLAAHGDEPVGDPSAIAQLSMCLAARGHADCALSAHGAAALWSGYTRHRVERIETAIRTWLAAPVAALGAEIVRPVRDSVKGARALSRLALPPAEGCAVKHAYGLWDDEYRRTVYTRDFAWHVRDSNPYARHLELYTSRDTDPLDRALYVDAHTFLADSVLPVAELAARTAGMRLRMPMVDRELVECAAAAPTAMKQRGGVGMYALRAILAHELPEGLMPPARRLPARHAWLRPALGSLVPAVLLGPRFDGRGIVSRPALRQLWGEHQTGRGNHTHRLWSLLMLELWFRDAIDGNPAETPAEYAVLTSRHARVRDDAAVKAA